MFNRTKHIITAEERSELLQREIEVLQNRKNKLDKKLTKPVVQPTETVDLFAGMEPSPRSNSWSLEEDVVLAEKLTELVNRFGLNHPNKYRDVLAVNIVNAGLIGRKPTGAKHRIHSVFKSLFGIGSDSVRLLSNERTVELRSIARK